MEPAWDWKGHTVDVAIVGAGAAGVGAARRLQAIRPDLSVLVLEASDRVGGRAFTASPPALAGHAIDLGCGWLHGARTNEWTRIAQEIGLTVDKTPAPWSEGGKRIDSDTEEERDARTAINSFFERIEMRGGQEPDGALSDMLDPGNRWNGRIDAIGTFLNGVELDQASIIDYTRYDPGPGPDWRVREGYGTLVAAYGRPAVIQCGAVVTRIDHRGAESVRIVTSLGTLNARAVIVTVSTNMLARESIRFDPALPAKIDAATRLPLGLANKVFLRVSNANDLPTDTQLLGVPERTATGSYHLRPFGSDVIEGYFAGHLAHDLEKAGEAGAFAFALDELTARFGSGFRSRLEPVVLSAWGQVAHIGGSYSYAKPGAADERTRLGATVDDRLFFAGEACSPARFTTAHGAYETGVAAAEEAAKSSAVIGGKNAS